MGSQFPLSYKNQEKPTEKDFIDLKEAIEEFKIDCQEDFENKT